MFLMMRAYLAALVLVSTCASALAAANPDPPLLQMGLGTLSCATWLTNADAERRGAQWVFGMFSGMNMMTAIGDKPGVVGKSTDQPGVIAAVKKVCDADRSLLLSTATTTVYFRLYQEGR